NAFDNNPVFWADPSGADAMVNIGYDREVSASDIMGSVQFSGAISSNVLGIDPPKGNWFWNSKNSSFVFDPAMESEEHFNALVEQGLIEGIYIGMGGEYEVTRGGTRIGRVSLHSGGSWTDYTSSNVSQWVYHRKNGDSSYTN